MTELSFSFENALIIGQPEFAMPNQFYVYILTNESRTLYIGMTNNLERRISEHRQKLIPAFTAKYNISKLVVYTDFPSAS